MICFGGLFYFWVYDYCLTLLSKLRGRKNGRYGNYTAGVDFVILYVNFSSFC